MDLLLNLLPCIAHSPSMSTYKNTSPAKKLRGIKRLLTFLQNKSQVKSSDVPKSLSIYQQPSISIFPSALKPKLIATFQSSMDIPPTTQEKPKLQVVKTQSTSIPPRPIYHPAIINASDAMFSKHPSQLLPEEVVKFNAYTYKSKTANRRTSGDGDNLPAYWRNKNLPALWRNNLN